MKQNTNLLSQQVQRLLISDADRQRLLDEIKDMTSAQLQELAKLIGAHDKESLEVMEKKIAEKAEAANADLRTPAASQQDISGDDVEEVMATMEEVLFDTDKLADFLAAADDELLAKLEAIFIEAEKNKPQASADLTAFFNEIRLQKVALEKEEQERKEKLLNPAIKEQHEAVADLQAAIAEANAAVEGVKK